MRIIQSKLTQIAITDDSKYIVAGGEDRTISIFGIEWIPRLILGEEPETNLSQRFSEESRAGLGVVQVPQGDHVDRPTERRP